MGGPAPSVSPATVARPRVGVVKFASCDGCQLTLLDLEDELLEIAGRFDIVEFPEASSSRSEGPYDVLFVEGSVSTPEQAEQIVELRRQAKLLVTIGACAMPAPGATKIAAAAAARSHLRIDVFLRWSAETDFC